MSHPHEIFSQQCPTKLLKYSKENLPHTCVSPIEDNVWQTLCVLLATCTHSTWIKKKNKHKEFPEQAYDTDVAAKGNTRRTDCRMSEAVCHRQTLFLVSHP